MMDPTMTVMKGAAHHQHKENNKNKVQVQEDSHLCNKDNQAQGTTTEDEYDDSLANYSLMEQDDQLSDTEDNYLLSQSITLK